MRFIFMKSRMFVTSLVAAGGLLFVATQCVAAPMTSDAATPKSHTPDATENVAPPTPDAPVMVDEAASPTHFGDAKTNSDFRFSDTAEADPYETMLRDLVVGALPARNRTQQAPTTADDDAALNFYSKEELKARIHAVKGGIAAMLGSDGRTEQSEEARELELERRIAMRGAYGDARLSGGTGVASAGSSEQRRRAQEDEERARLHLAEILFFIWDVLTHPATIAALVLVALVRAVVFLMRFAPARRGHRPRGKRRHSRSRTRSPRIAAPVAIQETVAANIEAEKPRHRRRRRRRRSFLDIFRSA